MSIISLHHAYQHAFPREGLFNLLVRPKWLLFRAPFTVCMCLIATCFLPVFLSSFVIAVPVHSVAENTLREFLTFNTIDIQSILNRTCNFLALWQQREHFGNWLLLNTVKINELHNWWKLLIIFNIWQKHNFFTNDPMLSYVLWLLRFYLITLHLLNSSMLRKVSFSIAV